MTAKNSWRRGSKREMIAQCARDGKTRFQAFLELRELTEQGIEPMVFKMNTEHGRVPKSLPAQLLELKFEINRVYRLLEIAGNDLPSGEEEPEDEAMPEDEIPEADDSEDDTVEAEEEIPVRASGKVKTENSLRSFLSEVRRIRQFCNDRAASGESIDRISMRPLVAGQKLIPAGVPVDALIAAMTLSWPDGAKRDAGIPEFDFVSFSKGVMKLRGIEEGRFHELFGYALTLAENRIPIMLVGDFGTGKSFMGRQLAEYLSLDYGETPMTAGAMRGDLLGRWIGDDKFISSEFCRLYAEGGVFNFEEIDASDASMLIVLNNAIANDVLYNSIDGNNYVKSENFIPVATGNTFGLGATREYVARERQDAATLDRWRMGRIVVPIDEKVEEKILGL